MTGLLRDALTERAAAEEAPHLDLDAIVRTGDRRIRRRRGLTGLAAAAALATVVASGAVVLDRTAADAPADGPAPFTQRRVTWASGDTIHYGDQKIAIGPANIAAFIQTDSGFVLTDRSGVVSVADGRTVTRIGAGNLSLRLIADDTGSWVGWVDGTAAVPEFVVYDVATRRELLRTADGNTARLNWTAPNAPAAVDIDDGYAYFAAADGLRRWEIATGRGLLLERGLTGGQVEDVAAGKLAVQRRGATGDQLVVSADLGARAPRFDGSSGSLSPGAKHLIPGQADIKLVFSVEHGTVRELRHSEHDLYAPSQWLDDNRFVALGVKDGEHKWQVPPFDLLVCSIGSGCEVAVPAFAPYAGSPDFRLPDGLSRPPK